MGMQVNLRDLANLTEAEVLRWRGHRLAVDVTDDEGKVAKSDTFALMLTWQGLIIHRHYNHVPYSIKQLIPTNTGENQGVVYNDRTLAIPIEYTMQEVMPNIHDPLENDFIKRMVHVWQAKLNNLIVVMSERAVLSATAECVDDLMVNPGIVDLRNKVLSGEVGVDEGEQIFSEYIKFDPSLNTNTVALMARTGGVSINQAYQLAIYRGSVFDLRNTIQPNAIESNYGEGIVNTADMLGDSKGSGKSLVSNGKGLKDSEWFHRKTHLATAVIQSIYHTFDCGSPDLVSMKVTSSAMAVSLLGKYRLMPAGNLEMIDQKTVKLIKAGDTIEFRSVAFCNSGRNGEPCGKCYGAMKAHIPYNAIMRRDANVGMYAATTICNPLGQKMLSTKHFIRHAVTKRFVVSDRDRQIISTNGNDIFLMPGMCTKGSRIILRSSIVKDLADLRSLDVLDEITIDSLPYFSEVTFQYDIEDVMVGGVTVQQHTAQTSVSSRASRFSLGFLQYVIDQGWEVLDKRSISVDLEKWNIAEPIFVLPFTREDLDAHRSRVENFLTFNKRNAAWKAQVVTPRGFGEVLSEFWTLIDQETKGINMVHAEVMLAALLCKDPANFSYKLSLGSGPKYFENFVTCFKNRGAGTLMISEGQQLVLNNPKTFLVKDRSASPIETFFQHGVS